MIKNGLSVLLKSQKGFVERMVVSDGVSSAAAAAAMGSRRFFNTGALMKRDMFRAGADIPNLFRGRQTGGRCVRSSVPHQCNRSHMLPYFARALASSSSASQSSGQSQRQEPEKKKKECQIKTSSELQRESCDEIPSTKVSLNQFPGLMVHGNVEDSKTRRLLRLNPDTGYFEEEQDVSAAASNHHGHYDLQVPNGHVCRGSAYGWLFLTDDNLDMKLLNPFSGAEIQLPPSKTLPPFEKGEGWFCPSKWCVFKAVFSANPSIEPRPVVLINYQGPFYRTRLAFCKPGDRGWTHLELSECPVFMDAIYHKGQFYVLGFDGYVAAFDIGRRIDDDDHSVKTILIADSSFRSLCGSDPLYEHLQPHLRNSYLVVLDGELVKFELRSACFYDVCIGETKKLLEMERNRDGDTSDEEDCTDAESDDVVVDSDDGKKEWVVVDPRLCCVDPRPPFCTYSIKIRRFDASEKQWVKVESLGDKAVFLGFNTSFAISASDYPAGVCIPDSVYFIDGGCSRLHKLELSLYDMGIYNVKDKWVKPLYPIPMDDTSKFLKPAPIWIVNSADS